MSKKPTAANFIMPPASECQDNFRKNKHLVHEFVHVANEMVEKGVYVDYEFHPFGYLLMFSLRMGGVDGVLLYRGDLELYRKPQKAAKQLNKFKSFVKKYDLKGNENASKN